MEEKEAGSSQWCMRDSEEPYRISDRPGVPSKPDTPSPHCPTSCKGTVQGAQKEIRGWKKTAHGSCRSYKTVYRHCREFKGGFVNSGSVGDKAVRSPPPATLVLMMESGKEFGNVESVLKRVYRVPPKVEATDKGCRTPEVTIPSRKLDPGKEAAKLPEELLGPLVQLQELLITTQASSVHDRNRAFRLASKYLGEELKSQADVDGDEDAKNIYLETIQRQNDEQLYEASQRDSFILGVELKDPHAKQVSSQPPVLPVVKVQHSRIKLQTEHPARLPYTSPSGDAVRDGDSTTSLGSLFQCWTTLPAVVESDEVSPQPPSLQAEQRQGPQPLPISLVLQTLPQLRCPCLDTLQPLNVSLVARGPTLNTAFEVRPHQCRVQGHNHCPTPAGHAIPDTSQDAVGFLGHLGTLPAHIQLAVDQHPQCRIRHLALLNLIQLASAHRSSLSRSLCRAFLPSSRSTLLPNLVSSENFLRVCSIPSSRSLIKILNKTGPNTDPWGTPLVTGRQLELTPFTTTLWARPSSQFFTQRRARPSKP
ncbi:hypothetical protein QYF61_014635 [Mycteria americana]|uniref:Uncharacterized protein n=1 Tax=Mycteria americana TaxID=33587 RepID=A0AAN7N5V9_MYCAM|nr:hypothetical protein QYF61_014635 [Mycteria americana]